MLDVSECNYAILCVSQAQINLTKGGTNYL